MNPRLLAYAQLLRLPNVFTAFADIAMGACAAGYLPERPDSFLLLLLTSGYLYLGGMVWNDVFDRREDAATRPFRPLPSGRIRVRSALILGTILLLTGIGFASLVDSNPSLLIASGLTVAILAYDGVLKRTPFGPLGMGLCRALNVLLGVSGGTGDHLAPLSMHLAATIGIYIVGVTMLAKTEEGESCRTHLRAAAFVMLVAAILAVTLPVHLRPGTAPVYYLLLVVAAGVLIGIKVQLAIRNPQPKVVQAAVKRCIFGLVALDAVLATAFVGWPGLSILLLLAPAVWLGMRVYST